MFELSAVDSKNKYLCNDKYLWEAELYKLITKRLAYMAMTR